MIEKPIIFLLLATAVILVGTIVTMVVPSNGLTIRS